MTKRLIMIGGTLLLAACGGGDGQQQRTDGAPPAASPAVPQPGTPAPAAAAQDTAKAAPTATDGRAVYGRTCATCHQANGQGMTGAFPPLAASEYVNGDKNRLISIVLHGLQGPITVKGQTYNSVMTPLKGQLNDAEIAAVLSYVRSNFGNNSSAVTPQEVAAQRAATASRTTPLTAADIR